jgi:HK97 family phage major capsid protein
MLEALREQRAAVAAEADSLLAGEPTTEALASVEERQSVIESLDAQISKVEATEARTAAIAESRAVVGVESYSPARVVREARTYTERGEHSFVRDMIGGTLRNDPQSWDRLHRHSTEAAIESRDVSRTDGGIGEFVPPAWVVDSFAEFARAQRVTADLCTSMALPAGTDSINIPAITTGTQVAAQTADNAATNTRDMVTATVTAPVRTLSGYQNVSLQTVEQSPLAGGLDRLILGDLMADYALQLNTAVVSNNAGTSNGALKGFTNLGTDTTNGIPVTWTETTPSAANGIKAIAQALSKVATNRFRESEAVVMTPQLWYWLASAVDGSGRPLVVPTAGGPMNANGVNSAAGAAAGLVGTIHGVPVYLDATLPTINTNQVPMLVGKFSDSYLFEGGVKTRVLPDVLSANLTVRFQVYGYVALAHRFAKAVSGISGTGTVSPTGF